jgi:hypothetical protein
LALAAGLALALALGLALAAGFAFAFVTFAIRVSSLSNVRFRLIGPGQSAPPTVRNRLLHPGGLPSMNVL